VHFGGGEDGLEVHGLPDGTGFDVLGFERETDLLARDAGDTTPRRRICCRPYDLCTILIVEEAGVIVNDGRGNPVDAPLDTISDVAWAGYANRSLANQIQPVLSRLLAELASHR
jgi:hypothetical protein